MRDKEAFQVVSRALEWIFVGGPWTPVVTVVVALQILVFGLSLLVGPELAGRLWLGAGSYDVWRFLSFPLVSHPRGAVGLAQIAANLLAFGIVAGEVSLLLGPRRFLLFYVLSMAGSLGGGLIYDPGQPVYGAIGPASATIMAFGLLQPNRRIYGKIPARLYALLLWGALGGSHYLLFRHVAPATQLGSFLSQAIGGILATYFFFLLRPIFRRRLLLHGMFQQLREMQEEDYVKERVDQLLEKISRLGLPSLAKDEFRFLARASRRYHDSHRRESEERRRRAKSENSHPK